MSAAVEVRQVGDGMVSFRIPTSVFELRGPAMHCAARFEIRFAMGSDFGVTFNRTLMQIAEAISGDTPSVRKAMGDLLENWQTGDLEQLTAGVNEAMVRAGL